MFAGVTMNEVVPLLLAISLSAIALVVFLAAESEGWMVQMHRVFTLV
jgi:hypothetical protein